MADTNIFNTFSFKVWSERLREAKMEEEIQKQASFCRTASKLAEKSIDERFDSTAILSKMSKDLIPRNNDCNL